MKTISLTDPRLTADVRRAFDGMAHDVTWPDQLANQWPVSRPTPDMVEAEVSRCYRLDALRELGTPEVAFIAKPYGIDALASAVRQALSK